MLPDDSIVSLDHGAMRTFTEARGLCGLLEKPRISPGMALFGIVVSSGPGHDVLVSAGLTGNRVMAQLLIDAP
jgi:hypothetical protein